jgi:hypothetical protein
LGLGDETRHVFNGRSIFAGEAIALRFDARLHKQKKTDAEMRMTLISSKRCSIPYLFDQHTGIRGESGEGDGQMVVQLRDFSNGARVLELSNSLSLHTQDNTVSASDTDNSRSSLDCFHRIFYLKQMPIGREDGNGSVVTHFHWKFLAKVFSMKKKKPH